MSLLGYHIDGLDITHNTPIKEQLKRTKSNYHHIMDDKLFALEMLPHVKKGIIYRAFDPFSEHGGKQDFDNDFWTRHSPVKVAEWMKQNLGDLAVHPNIYFTAGNNEPSSDSGNRRALIKWLTDLMHECYKRNIRLAVGEIAVAKTLEIDEIQAGWWDEFLDVLYLYRDFHIFTLHEYSTGVLAANFIFGYPQNLLNRDLLNNRANWIKQIPLEGYPGNYHLGRWHWLRTRAIERGKPIKRVVITECALDIMEDNNENGEWLRNVLKPQFPAGEFERLKGWAGHRPYWKWLLSKHDETSWQQFMYDNYEWFARASAPEVEGLCMFALNYDWYITEGVDLSRDDVGHFRYLVETIPVLKGATMPMVTKYVRALNNQLRIREKPTTQNSNTIGWISTEFTQMQISGASPNEPAIAVADGYRWYAVNNGGVNGYSALFTSDNVPLVEIRDTAPSAQTVTISKTDFDTLKSILDKYA